MKVIIQELEVKDELFHRPKRTFGIFQADLALKMVTTDSLDLAQAICRNMHWYVEIVLFIDESKVPQTSALLTH